MNRFDMLERPLPVLYGVLYTIRLLNLILNFYFVGSVVDMVRYDVLTSEKGHSLTKVL